MADDPNAKIKPPPDMPSWAPLAMMILGSGLGGLKYGNRDRSWNFGAPFKALGDYGGFAAQTSMQQSALEQERKKLMEMQEGLSRRERERSQSEWDVATRPGQPVPLAGDMQGPPAPGPSPWEEALQGKSDALGKLPPGMRAGAASFQMEKPFRERELALREAGEKSLEEYRKKKAKYIRVPGVGLVRVEDEEDSEGRPVDGGTESTKVVVPQPEKSKAPTLLEKIMAKPESEWTPAERALVNKQTTFAPKAPGKAGATPSGGIEREARGRIGWGTLLFGKDAGVGYSKEQRAVGLNEAARIGKQLGLSDMEMAMLPQDNRVKMKAVDALTKWGAFVDKGAEQLDKTIDIAIDYAKRIDPIKLRTLNRAVIAGKLEFNDPLMNAYALQVNTIRNEYGRLQSGPTSNAMLPVEAMKQGERLISEAMDVPSWLEAKKAILRDAQATTASVKHQRDMLHDSITGLGKTSGMPKAKSETPMSGPPGSSQQDENNAILDRADAILKGQ